MMIINFLWVGDKLGKLEQLTLSSFANKQHEPHLWVYNKDCAGVPSNVVIRDASEIIPSDKVFSYSGGGDCRTGSYGGFSDIFRYYLLKKIGGWYCDMDVTCLRNFSDIDTQPYLFRPHLRVGLVGNIMKCPADSDFINECIEATEKQVDKNNTRWVLPVQILKDCAYKHKLEKYIAPVEWFGDDNIDAIKKLIAIGAFMSAEILPKYAIHWCHEAVSTGKWDRSIKRDFNTPVPTTLYYNLLKQHNLL